MAADDFGTNFNTSDGVNNHYSGINNVQRRDNSSYEIVCSRRVNEIELVLLPFCIQYSREY